MVYHCTQTYSTDLYYIIINSALWLEVCRLYNKHFLSGVDKHHPYFVLQCHTEAYCWSCMTRVSVLL